MASEATWTKRVAQWRASGLTAALFCERRDFAKATLLWWSSRLGRRNEERQSAPTVRIARVIRRPTAGGNETPLSAGALVLEIGAVRVRVPVGFDEPTLATVLDLLMRRTLWGRQ